MSRTEEFSAEKFDYIIVGGGTAGLTLAARLSENPDMAVVVLEAGEAHLDDPRVMTPGLAVSLHDDAGYDWCFKTVPQKNCMQRVFAWPRGRGLGGSSMINFGVMTYPSKREIDSWNKLGNPGWTWDELFPYFLKSETFNPAPKDTAPATDSMYVEPDAHGQHGPIQTSFAPISGPFNDAFKPTMENLGFKAKGDPKRGLTIGAYTHPLSVDPKAATRSYAVTGYYLPNSQRPNLSVLTEAVGTKIVFEKGLEGTELKATGVSFIRNGRSHIIRAKREVLLCGGTLGSPQLLEVSGVGSPSVLKSIGVEALIENENVGENLQDHIGVVHMFETSDPTLLGPSLLDPVVFKAAMEEYLRSRSGPLAVGGITNLAYLSSVDYVPTEEKHGLKAEIEHALEENPGPTDRPGLQQQYQALKELLLNPEEAGGQLRLVPGQVDLAHPVQKMSTAFAGTHPGAYITLISSITRPFSRGSIHACSKDTMVPPIIDPNLLSHPLDHRLLAKQASFLETIGQTEPLASLLKDRGKCYIPDLQDTTPEYRARRFNSTEWHPCGTCSMLPRDEGGVVDSTLRVYGTKNVRVIDASIFPLIPRGNPQSLVYAVAEKAADIIKSGW
ncbi:CAZyme family AA3 [Paecilomyces variotii]|nr:CAZyme family AA3 [Paecilomyces variotii]